MLRQETLNPNPNLFDEPIDLSVTEGSFPAARINETLNFSRTSIIAHGVNADGRAVIACHSFITPPDNNGIPYAPICFPDGDAYLNGLAIGASASGDIVVALRTVPGLIDYYRKIGVVSADTYIIEVSPDLREDCSLGYPNGDPISLLIKDQRALSEFQSKIGNGNPLIVTTFINETQRRQAVELGIEVVQLSEPRDTNNKAAFRAEAEEYQYSVAPGFELKQEADLKNCVELALDTVVRRVIMGDVPNSDADKDSWHCVRLKLSHGSGGDFVQSIKISPKAINLIKQEILEATQSGVEPGVIVKSLLNSEDELLITKEAMSAAVAAHHNLRFTVQQAFKLNDYGQGSHQKFWPAGSFVPNPECAKIIAEQDVSAFGEMILNGSNLIVVNHDGSYSVKGWFKQITSRDGEYIGSAPFDPITLGSSIHQELEMQIKGIVSMCHEMKLYGYVGVDFFCVQDNNGNRQLFMTELNGRIPISGTAKIIADKLGAPAWINTNITVMDPIESIEQFHRLFGSYADYTPGNFSEAKVIPQAFRTMQDGLGGSRPSPMFKALIIGPDEESCNRLIEAMRKDQIIK